MALWGTYNHGRQIVAPVMVWSGTDGLQGLQGAQRVYTYKM
jgi:hypothetical protein